jgi:hypothetical protein
MRTPLVTHIGAVLAFCVAPAQATVVLSCTDDGPADIANLRNSISNTGDGGTVDLSALACSEIALHLGQIVIGQGTLTLKGPDSGALAITGIYNGTQQAARLFDHQGSGVLTIRNLSIRDGHLDANGAAARGGCIHSAGSVTLDHAAVTQCLATSTGVGASVYAQGGGIFAASGLTLRNSVVSGNEAGLDTVAAWGGGVFVDSGTLKMYDSTLSGNKAGTTGAYGYCGGACVSGSILISGSTISGNVATAGGGGLSAGGGTATISNSTISGNSALAGVGGGALLIGVPNVEINHSTVAFNHAGSAAGQFAAYAPGVAIYAPGAGQLNVTLQSSLFSNNSFGPASTQYDLSIESSAVLAGANNLVHITGSEVPVGTKLGNEALAALGPLRDNGGPTLTHALASNSAALDTGNYSGAPPNDQRGAPFTRFSGAQVDIGAYEYDQSEIISSSGFEGFP